MTLKYSRQREAVKQFLMTRRDHPTADMVYRHVRNEFPNISLGTVYRNLTLLANLGEISRLRLGDGVDHFDYDTHPHIHFVCSRCKSVSDLETEETSLINESAVKHFDGQIEGHFTYFYGLCPRCNENRPKSR